MATFIYIDGVDDAYAVRWPDGYEVTSSAETGTVNTGRIEIDDPTGSLDIVPLKGAYIVETLAPAGNQRIWTGYIQNLTIDRGPYRTGAGRVWRADCVDVNYDLVRRFDVASSGKRPAETDVVRLSWILNGNLATVGLVYQGTLTNLTDNIKNLDEADYTFLTPMEMLADMAPQCGKRAFAFYNESTAKVELFYDLADAAVNTSSSTISNDIADTTAYPPFIDGSLSRLGEEIYSKGVLRWVGGNTTQERLDTKAAYNDHWYTSESSRIGRAATAASWLATFLEVHSVPEDTLTCTLLLPAAHVNDIREGQRLQVKFTHLPGLATFTYRRVISRVLKRDPTDNYLVQLLLDNHAGTAIGGGPGVGGFPNPPPADVPPPYDACLINSVGFGADSSPTTVTFYNGDVYTCDYSVRQATDNGGSGISTRWSEYPIGSTTFGVHSFGHPVGTQTATETWTVSGVGSPSGSPFIFVGSINTDVFTSALDFEWCAVLSLVTPGPDNPNAPTGPGASQPPRPGQWVYGETPTPAPGGGRVTFFTAFPFADGSLKVYVDHVEETAAITSYDGAAGSFTLAFDPRSWETLLVDYQGR